MRNVPLWCNYVFIRAFWKTLYLYLLYDPWIDYEVEHAFVLLLLLLFLNNLSVNLKAQCVSFGSIYLRESILPANVNTSLFAIFSIFD